MHVGGNMKAAKSLGFWGPLALTLVIGVLPCAAATGHFERTMQVSGTVELEVYSGSGNINVHVGGNGTVAVTARLHGSNSSWLFGGGDVEDRIRRIEQHPPIEQNGNFIRIGKFEDRDLQRNISIDYDVTVPAQTKLNSQTGSGDQTITGVQLAANAKTGSGNITAENLGADAQISSGSGDLKINSIKGVLHADTGSGNVRAQGV